MTPNRSPYRLQLFTLRLWQEVVNGELCEWRGAVKNVSNGEVRYFQDFHVLADLLPTLLGEPIAYEVQDQRQILPDESGGL